MNFALAVCSLLSLHGALAICGAEEKSPAPHLEFITEVRRFETPCGEIESVSFSPGGERAMVVSSGSIFQWIVASGTPLRTLTPVTKSVQCAAFSPDGKRIAVSGADDILLLDAETGEEIRRYRGHQYGTGYVLFSPDGRLISACGGSDFSRPGRQAIVWEVETGREITRVKGGYGHACLAFSPDSKWLLSTSYRFADLYEADTGKLLRQFGGGNHSVAFSPDGKRVVTTGSDAAFIWDAASGAELLKLPTGHFPNRGARVFSSAHLLPGSKHLLTEGGGLRLWDIESGAELSWSDDPSIEMLHDRAGNPSNPQRAKAALSPDGRFVLTDSAKQEDKTFAKGARLWKLPGEAPAAVPLPPPFAHTAPGQRPRPALITAALLCDAPRVRALLARGADVQAMDGSSDRPGPTALHCGTRQIDVVRLLLQHAAPVNAGDDQRRTPLHIAVKNCAEWHEYQRPEEEKAARAIVALLLEKGADANAQSNLWYEATPLRIAAKAQHKELVDLLISHGAPYDFIPAVMLGDLERMKTLLRADPTLANKPIEVGYTPLFFARTAECIELLLAHGAQLEAKGPWNETPLFYLLGYGEKYLDLAALLKKKGADMHAKNRDAETPASRWAEIERRRK